MVKSKIWSGIASYIAIPVWLFCLFFWVRSYGGNINSAGVIIYMGLLAIIGIPFALLVSFLIAPILTKLNKRSKLISFFNIICFHGALLFCLYLFDASFSSKPSELANSLIVPFYLLLFLTPPSFIGCIIYLLLSEFREYDE